MRSQAKQPGIKTQRGLSVVGVLVWAVIVVAVVIIVAKVTPSVSEYITCVKAVKLAANEATPNEARSSFERSASVGYISSISSKDLEITQDASDSMIVSFAYNKEINLFGPVYLLIKYRGSSNPGAAIAKAAASAAGGGE